MRTSKATINTAIDHMTSTLTKAAGPDKRVSEHDAKSAIKKIEDKVERDATRQFHKFAAARATQADGAQLGLTELKSAASYIKSNIEGYDVNNNGISESEVKKMPRTSMLAVRLAQSNFQKD